MVSYWNFLKLFIQIVYLYQILQTCLFFIISRLSMQSDDKALSSVIEQKHFSLPQPGIEPRSLDLQAKNSITYCKSRLLPQGSRRVLYIPRPCEIHPSNLKFVPEFQATGITWNETKGIFMHRTVIGWVIWGGRHCRRANIFQPAQAGNGTQVTGYTSIRSTTSL